MFLLSGGIIFNLTDTKVIIKRLSVYELSHNYNFVFGRNQYVNFLGLKPGED